MNELPDWVSVLSLVIAVAAFVLGICNFWLAIRRRRDDLFDRRYNFYRRVRSMWLATGNGAPEGQRPWLETEELIPIAEEAGFLFGSDISQHIVSLAEPPFADGHRGHPDWPDEDFVAPFRKYLSLGSWL
jgi:hypothetical protein